MSPWKNTATFVCHAKLTKFFVSKEFFAVLMMHNVGSEKLNRGNFNFMNNLIWVNLVIKLCFVNIMQVFRLYMFNE